jgi:hypothetical protein
MADKLEALERENRELRQANEIQRKASAYFATGARPPVQAMIAFIDDHRGAHGVATLQLLRDTVGDCLADGRERYYEPIRRHLRPYLNDLFPGAELELGEGSRSRETNGRVRRVSSGFPAGPKSKSRFSSASPWATCWRNAAATCRSSSTTRWSIATMSAST